MQNICFSYCFFHTPKYVFIKICKIYACYIIAQQHFSSFCRQASGNFSSSVEVALFGKQNMPEKELFAFAHTSDNMGPTKENGLFDYNKKPESKPEAEALYTAIKTAQAQVIHKNY